MAKKGGREKMITQAVRDRFLQRRLKAAHAGSQRPWLFDSEKLKWKKNPTQMRRRKSSLYLSLSLHDRVHLLATSTQRSGLLVAWRSSSCMDPRTSESACVSFSDFWDNPKKIVAFFFLFSSFTALQVLVYLRPADLFISLFFFMYITSRTGLVCVFIYFLEFNYYLIVSPVNRNERKEFCSVPYWNWNEKDKPIKLIVHIYFI